MSTPVNNSTIPQSWWLDDDALDFLRHEKGLVESRGIQLIDLSMINPDLPPPRLLLDKLLEATGKTSTHKYAVSRGVRKLREAFAHKYRQKFSVEIDPESQVCVTLGTKDAILQTLHCVASPGDNVVIGVPAYPAFLSAARLAGLVPHYFKLHLDEEKLLLALEQSLDQVRPKALLLNFPGNPQGRLMSESGLVKIVELARAYGTIVINDFVYGEMGLDSITPRSILSVPHALDCAVETYSLSKAYSIPGWRVGALLGKSQVVHSLARLKSRIDYGLFLPLQTAAAAALTTQSDLISSNLSEYSRRKRVMNKGLEALGFESTAPQAGVSLWCKIPAQIKDRDGLTFCRHLLATTGILSMPGCLFGPGCEEWLRFALVAPEERLREALTRMELALATENFNSMSSVRISE